MEDNPEGMKFLKQKYDLHKAPEVDRAVERTETRTGEKVPQDPLIRIQTYLDRIDRIINPPGSPNPRIDHEHRRQRNISILKTSLLDAFLTKLEDIPESFWKSQEMILRERGQQGDYDRFSQEEKEQWKRELSQGLLKDQATSLEQWIDYFASPDSDAIPHSLKYWVFRSVVGLQEYDKDTKKFPKRSKGTMKNFPDINSEALGYVVDAMQSKLKGKEVDFGSFETELTEEQKSEFRQALHHENFADLYAWANDIIRPIPTHLLSTTQGEWRIYPQGSDHTQLVKDIRGKGTGWCTAGETYAQTQLQGGDFYVFFSNDKQGNPLYPRIAIRMEGNSIAEVRGIAKRQNLDSHMGSVLEEKLAEFPDKDKYLKRESDMKHLTEIEHKTQKGQDLSRDDLIFLYEIESNIEGFGYVEDPRIVELRGHRNLQEDFNIVYPHLVSVAEKTESGTPCTKEELIALWETRSEPFSTIIAGLRAKRNVEYDMPVIFDCESHQIAHKASEIRADTKAYVGALSPEIIRQLHQIEYVYTSYPEGKVKKALEIGGQTKEELEAELRASGVQISFYAEDMLHSPDFVTLADKETIDLVRITVAELGFTNATTINEIYARANELGLELVPPEVGPRYRLAHIDQPNGDCVVMGMKQITDRNGNLNVFDVYRDGAKRWLDGDWADPGSRWNPDSRFVFRLRKLDTAGS